MLNLMCYFNKSMNEVQYDNIHINVEIGTQTYYTYLNISTYLQCLQLVKVEFIIF